MRVAALLALLLASATTFAGEAFVPGRILIKPRTGVSDSEVDAELRPHGAKQRLALRRLNVRLLDVSEDKADQILEALRRNPKIEFAERDYVAQAAYAPNDPEVVSGAEWHLAKIQAPQAWDTTTGSSNVIVAVLDSGIDMSHPDLAGRTLPGYNFVSDTSDASDDFGHGTAVAGTVAASGNNGIGVAGVAFGCRLLPVKVMDASGFATYSAIAQGINYAVDEGARVINISIAGNSPSSTLQNAINCAWSKNVVVVAAAGNNGNNSPQYPAACSNVVGVSSTTAADTLSGFSSYGAAVALSAPGETIWTTQRGLANQYGTWQGTSMACPVVAGVAALAASANASLSGAQIVSTLEQSADDLGTAGRDDFFGFGRVNAARAVNLAIATPGMITPPAITDQPDSQTVMAGSTAVFTVGAIGAEPRTYQWKLNGVAIAGATGSTFAKANAQPNDAGNYSVVVSNALGAAASQPATLSVQVPAPDKLSLLSSGSGNMQISWGAISGRTYRVQFKTSLSGTAWTDLAPDVLATSSTATAIDQPKGAAQRFYRIILLP